MIICIGPKNAGKTLLLRRLQLTELHCDPLSEIFSTVSTVGVNIAQISLTKSKKLKIHELGGSMAAIWPMHFDGCRAVIFVINAANMQQISCSSILLLETLKHPSLQSSKFALVLNHTDINSSVNVEEIKFLLRIEDVCSNAKQEITVIEASCLTGKGIKEIKEWLTQFCVDK